MHGNGIKFDGFTTRIFRDSKAAPEIHGGLTFEAWIAPQAYPWNWNAIVEQKKRYFFGLDATGHIGLRVFIDDQWRECVSALQVPFMQWPHIAATFDRNKGLLSTLTDKTLATCWSLDISWTQEVLSRSAGILSPCLPQHRETFRLPTLLMESSTN